MFTWIAKDHLQFPWHTERLYIYSCTKFLQSPLLLLTASCFLAAPRSTECCFVSHFLAFFIQSLSGQFLPWIVVFPESFCATTLYSPQCFVDCILIPSCIRHLFVIKSPCLPSKAKTCEALALSTAHCSFPSHATLLERTHPEEVLPTPPVFFSHLYFTSPIE